MPTRRPDNLPRGWLADKLRERTVRAKVTDPRAREAIFDRLGIDLPPGANTVRRRTRY
jgi:hypothetical protein